MKQDRLKFVENFLFYIKKSETIELKRGHKKSTKWNYKNLFKKR